MSAAAIRVAPPTEATPAGVPCPRCSAPVEPGDAFCASCGLPQPAAGPEAPAAAPAGFRCENCGAEVRGDAESRTATCPFCAAPYVVAIDPRLTGRQGPEFVIGFAVPRSGAERIFHDWLGSGGWFRPGDLRRSARAESLRGIYLPFWSFSMRSDSRWSAEIGEYWHRTETYTTTDANGKTTTHTRQVRETEWWPCAGGHHAYHSFYLVSGSKGLPQGIFEWVRPFHLLSLKRYAPRYLAGWLSEEYSIDRDAARTACEEEFRKREVEQVAALLPGDTRRHLRVQTDFSQVGSDLILLPIYLRSYRYGGKLYRVLINGQTGKIAGQRPISARRIGMVVGLALLVFLIVALIAWALGAGGGR